MKVVSFSVMLITFFIFNCAFADNLLNAPSSIVEKQAPLKRYGKSSSQGPVEMLLKSGVVFYQKFLSSQWGNECSHYPSCSKYSILSIKKYGAVMGFILTFDRLQHESNEARFSPLIKVDGITKVYDPVENNDFWWHKE